MLPRILLMHTGTQALKYATPGIMVLFFIASMIILPTHTTTAKLNTVREELNQVRNHVYNRYKSEPVLTMTIAVSAYSSTESQTDDTPCIAAKGYDLCTHDKENVVATNMLPLGTRIRFPELGDRMYTVVDRMNERYGARIDIWKKSSADATAFGVRYLAMEIFEN